MLLRGRVIELRAEEDGDLHITLADASDDKPGMVVAEIPANRSGVSFARSYLVGRKYSFRFASGQEEN